jgi:hypothetical protein
MTFRGKRGRGSAQAHRPKLLDRKGLTEILSKWASPTQLLVLSKKTRVSESQRNPELSANALSRESTAHYR